MTGELYYSLPADSFTPDDVEVITQRAELIIRTLASMVVRYEMQSDANATIHFLTFIVEQITATSVDDVESSLRQLRGLFECSDSYDGLTIRLVQHYTGDAYIH
ncbi:MAG: hypothetical protein ABIR91_03100 [Candidatus Saccharimonadales bacterium]